jgi:hypothetical protein
VILGAGARLIVPTREDEEAQDPAYPTPVASFNVTELKDKADKVGKDDNFRGMTIFNNILYYTKDSGTNGVNTMYLWARRVKPVRAASVFQHQEPRCRRPRFPMI